jgi:tetratricopeptide (TPR) repeat protein
MVLAGGLAAMSLAAWFGGWHAWGMYHFRAAQKAVARYEFQEALNEFECCLRVWPRDASLRLQAARAARRAHQLNRAAELLSAFEKQDITSDTALEEMLLRAQQGDLSEVEAELNQVAANNHPDSVLIWEAVAKGCMQVNRRREATHLWYLVIGKAPEHPDAHYWIGEQLEETGFRIDAIPSYQRAVELAPHRDVYRLALANVLLGFRKPSEAWPHYHELLQRSPDQPAVLLGAARCQYALGQFAAAQDYLDTLLRDHSDNAEGLALRGKVYRDQGNRAEAVRCLRKAYALAPNNLNIGSMLLNELRGEKQRGEATELSRKLQHLEVELQRIEELDRQLRKVQRSAKLRCEIGETCLRIGQDAQALRWLNGALQDDPAYKPAHAALARYYERNGQAEVAVFHRQRAGNGAD